MNMQTNNRKNTVAIRILENFQWHKNAYLLDRKSYISHFKSDHQGNDDDHH